MASMRSSLLTLLLEHSFEEEETATMLIMLLHPGEATTQICFFLLLLIKYNNSLRFRSKLKRPALLSPGLSPWSRLLASGEESSFLNVTGLTHSAFRMLVEALYDSPRVGLKRGRPASLDENGEVGLYLVFLGSMGSMKHLCLVFGVVPSVASDVIKKMRSLVVSRLRVNPHARVKFPDQAERREFARIIQARERLVTDCIGFVDGLSLPIQCSPDPLDQSRNFNGHYHDTRCNNVFAFGPNGKIFLSLVNAPGSWHDSTVCVPLAVCLIKNAPESCLCVDQGFPRNGVMHGRFVGPLSEKSLAKMSPRMRAAQLPLISAYISLRQASEWGMRALQGYCPRIKARLPYDKDIRRSLIDSVVLLHNFRTSLVGLNQITKVFSSENGEYINLEGYDRLRRYFPDIDEE